jgi:heat shock protein HtpX
MSGTAKTFMLMAALTALFMALGFLVAGRSGMLIALALAGAMNAWAWWNSDTMALRMHKAREVSPAEAPELYAMVARLSARAGIPTPRVHIIDSPHANAFATGRSPEKGAIAVTTGLLQILSRDELEGVVAHELAHIRNRDTLIMTVTATIAGAIGWLGNLAMMFGGSHERPNPLAMMVALVVAPFAAMLVQMAISRTREYGADRAAAEISGRPLALASALGKLSDRARRVPSDVANRDPAVAHLYIVHPAIGGGRDSLFSTHPDPANRIAALQALAGTMPPAGGAGGSRGPSALAAGAGRSRPSSSPWA